MKSAEGESIRCPQCKQADIRYADRLSILDPVMRPLGFDALRCSNCRKRFYRRLDIEIRR